MNPLLLLGYGAAFAVSLFCVRLLFALAGHVEHAFYLWLFPPVEVESDLNRHEPPVSHHPAKPSLWKRVTARIAHFLQALPPRLRRKA